MSTAIFTPRKSVIFGISIFLSTLCGILSTASPDAVASSLPRTMEPFPQQASLQPSPWSIPTPTPTERCMLSCFPVQVHVLLGQMHLICNELSGGPCFLSSDRMNPPSSPPRSPFMAFWERLSLSLGLITGAVPPLSVT